MYERNADFHALIIVRLDQEYKSSRRKSLLQKVCVPLLERNCLAQCVYFLYKPRSHICQVGSFRELLVRSCRWNCRVRIALLVAFALAVVSGCASSNGKIFTSRWAMDDEAYAGRYSAPYSDNKVEKWSRMGQQMVDARFQSGKTGGYVSGGLAEYKRLAAAGEIGVFHLPNAWTTGRIGLTGLIAEGIPTYLWGGIAGVRFHSPTRFAPYVGLAGMVGTGKTTAIADHNYVDGNGKIIFKGSEIEGPGVGIAAIIPEAGFSWWVNSGMRASLGASYYITTDGRNEDFLLVGLTFEGDFISGQDTHVHTLSPELQQVIDSEDYFKTELEPDATPAVPPADPAPEQMDSIQPPMDEALESPQASCPEQ